MGLSGGLALRLRRLSDHRAAEPPSKTAWWEHMEKAAMGLTKTADQKLTATGCLEDLPLKPGLTISQVERLPLR